MFPIPLVPIGGKESVRVVQIVDSNMREQKFAANIKMVRARIQADTVSIYTSKVIFACPTFVTRT